MINSSKDAPVYSICSYSYVLDSKGPQICCSFITMAPTPSAAAGAAAEKCLQDIHKQELKDCKQEYTYKVALNQATFKVFTAFTAQTKLAIKKIYQAYLAALKKNPTIINAVETNFNKFFFSFTVKSLDLFLPEILVFEVAAI